MSRYIGKIILHDEWQEFNVSQIGFAISYITGFMCSDANVEDVEIEGEEYLKITTNHNKFKYVANVSKTVKAATQYLKKLKSLSKSKFKFEIREII